MGRGLLSVDEFEGSSNAIFGTKLTIVNVFECRFHQFFDATDESGTFVVSERVRVLLPVVDKMVFTVFVGVTNPDSHKVVEREVGSEDEVAVVPGVADFGTQFSYGRCNYHKVMFE